MSQGEWSILNDPPDPNKDVVGIHAALLHTGKVLLFAYDEINDSYGVSSVVDPTTANRTKLPLNNDLFCAGQSFLPDGRLVVAGGANGSNDNVRALYTFLPTADSGIWNQNILPLPRGRWYPTLTTLPDGRIFIISGLEIAAGPSVNNTYEVFDLSTGLQPPKRAPILEEAHPYSIYPFVFVLPNNKLFIHVNDRTGFIDISNLSSGNFDSTLLHAHRRIPRTYPLQGSCVLLPLLPTSNPPYRVRIMLIGGGELTDNREDPSKDATDTCEILDFGIEPLAWRPAKSMPHKRVMPDSIILPDGTVLVVNGSSKGQADAAKDPVFEADLYDPSNDSWTTLRSMSIPRLYHSTALLLPDGSVMNAGTDERFNIPPYHRSEYRIEIFRLPYLFRGPTRPSINSLPSAVNYGMPFRITVSERITSAALIRQGAVTHSFNMDQRYVGLNIVYQSQDRVTLEAPPNSSIAPPGYYLLFVLNKKRVPSVGKFIKITRRLMASGPFIQSTVGRQGDFEMVVAQFDGLANNLVHYSRDNDAEGFPWHMKRIIYSVPPPAQRPKVVGSSLIQSNFGSGNLEVVARMQPIQGPLPGREGDHLSFFYYDSNAKQWYGPLDIKVDGRPIRGVTGDPALIQSTVGRQGDFEMVVAQFDGLANNLVHYSRDNDAEGFPWHMKRIIYSVPPPAQRPKVVGMSLIQSNFGSGNFELVARMRDTKSSAENEDSRDYLSLFYYESSTDKWHGPYDILVDGQRIEGVTGNPSLIQSNFGSQGSFEMILPQNNNQLVHYSRDNDAEGFPWHKRSVFYDSTSGASAGQAGGPLVIRAALIQSNFGSGNLEVVARMRPLLGDDYLSFFFYDSNAKQWYGPLDIKVDGRAIAGVTGF